MKKSIEISGKTIAYLIMAIGLMSGLILFINKYDNDRKIEKLEIALNELERFKTKGIQTILLSMDLDSLNESDLEEVGNHFLALDNDKALDNIYRWGSEILIKDDRDFYTINIGAVRSYGYPENGKIVRNKVLSKKEEKMIEAMEQPNVDVKKLIIDEFSFLDSPEIIYPIAANEKRKVFFYFTYYENR